MGLKMNIIERSYVENNLWTKFKADADQMWIDNIDRGVLDLVQKLNSIPGIATVWSCSGLEENHMFDSYMDGRQLDPYFTPFGYVVFVVNKDNSEGFESMLDLGLTFQNISFKLIRLFIPYDLDLLANVDCETRFTMQNSYCGWSFNWINREGLNSYKAFMDVFLNQLGGDYVSD